jgi:hypothetical protein
MSDHGHVAETNSGTEEYSFVTYGIQCNHYDYTPPFFSPQCLEEYFADSLTALSTFVLKNV